MRAQIVDDKVGDPDVLTYDTHQILVLAPLAIQHARWDLQALFKNFAIVDPEMPADVLMVEDASRKGDQPRVQEHGRRHQDVGKVTGHDPGIVGDDHVALPQALIRKVLVESLHRRRHAAYLAGGDEARLRQEVAARVVDGTGIVV